MAVTCCGGEGGQKMPMLNVILMFIPNQSWALALFDLSFPLKGSKFDHILSTVPVSVESCISGLL